MEPFENWLLKRTINNRYGTTISKLVPNHYQYPRRTIRKVERDGIKYKLDLSDLVDWYIYFGFKDLSKKSLFDKINPGDVIFDIGANMGDLSFNFSKLVGNKGHVYSFEPDAGNFERLVINCNLNKFQNITLIQKGVGNNPGFYKMEANEYEPGNDGSKRIVSTAIDNNSKMNDLAEIVSLDTWVEANNPEKIDLIKMDIEGYEYSAIQSAEKTLAQYSPTLYMELHDVKLKEHGSSASELCKLVEGFGYTIFDADSNAPYGDFDSLVDIHDDIVCFKLKK